MHVDDTIAAVATAVGGAARAVVRLSGPNVRACLETCFDGEQGGPLERVRGARVIEGRLRVEGFAARVPCDLYFWPDRRSYTRETVAELHTIGSPPLIEAILGTVCRAGARLAEPGEFTLRAFLAGRLDLTQAEAVLGVVDAQSASQLEVALAQLAGGLSQPLGALRDRLLDLLADLEAGLDFVEEDIEFVTAEQLDRRLAETAGTIADLLRQMEERAETAEQVRVALVGWPNVGKSSLFNALVGKDGALVASEPGTTRDYLTVRLELAGVPVELVDTAGVEPAAMPSAIAGAAQAMADEQHQRAHLRLMCLDSSRELNDWERDQLAGEAGGERLLVLTKSDARRALPATPGAIETSSHTGEGIDRLRTAIVEAVVRAQHAETSVVAGTAGRCRESLRLSAESLDRARRLVAHKLGEELVAAEIRVALTELGKVVGAVYTEDVLDRIFSRFCVGK